MSTHYAARGGATAYGDTCGGFFNTLNPLYSVGNWVYGAALSFKPFSTHYASRGSISNDGANCGTFCVSTLLTFSNTGWYFGATLL